MDFPELLNLTLLQTATALFLIAVVAFVLAVSLALYGGTFNAAFLDNFLVTHLAKRWAPIFGAAVLGGGVLGLPPIPAFTTAASLGLIAYAATVLATIQDNAQAATAARQARDDAAAAELRRRVTGAP